MQGDQMTGKKLPNFWTIKSSPNSCRAKKAKISASKLNLKVQNIYIKLLLKLLNACNKPRFETGY
jgi:hypothetical protein